MSDYEKHESYGMLQLTRTTGSPRTCFGSSISHQNTIRLRIKKGSVKRDLSTCWYYGYDEIIEIEMSPTQFVDSISNMNTEGTPVTIKYLNNKQMKESPQIQVKKEFENELSKDIERVLLNTRKMLKLSEETLKAKKPIKRAERDELAGVLFKIEQDIADNIHFVYRQFNKQMDKSVSEAKGEVEAFFINTIHSLGSKELIKQLENGTLKHQLIEE